MGLDQMLHLATRMGIVMDCCVKCEVRGGKGGRETERSKREEAKKRK